MNTEGMGRAMYEAAGLSVLRRPEGGALDLAIWRYGDDVIVRSKRAQTDGELGRVGGMLRIVVAPAGPQRTHWAIARMIARAELRKLGRWSAQSERELAAYLAAPSECVRACRDAGATVEEVAGHLVITQTCAAMRLVEVGCETGVIVTPDRVYRPRASMLWFSDDDARALARSRPRTLRKVTLSDEDERVALYRMAS